MPVQFTKQELDQQRRIKSAFDPGWLLNANKVFPLSGGQPPVGTVAR
jgi:glycolate oxidase